VLVLPEGTIQRRLAAILAADVVGYSALMERAEEATYAEIGRLRRDVIEPRLAQHQGRLIKTTGDGILAEFASPITAVPCAMEIQDHLAADGGAIQLRIGINLGDVIIDDRGDVYGEGINIAARLEGLAHPGGILISAKVHGEVAGKIDVTFDDWGERQLKNISKPVRAYAVRRAAVGQSAPFRNKLSTSDDRHQRMSVSVVAYLRNQLSAYVVAFGIRELKKFKIVVDS
jgi:adenylate cyclase